MKELTNIQKEALSKLDYPVDKMSELHNNIMKNHPSNLLEDGGPLGDVFKVFGLYGACPNPSCDISIAELRRLSASYAEIHKDISLGGVPTYLKLSTAMALITAINLLTWSIFNGYRGIEILGATDVKLRYSDKHYIPDRDQWTYIKWFIESRAVADILDALMAITELTID